jgi:peptide/nickel transport system substrate-binding protein
MMLTRRAALAGAAAGALAGKAAAQTLERRTLVVAAAMEPINFDPHVAESPAASTLVRNCYDALTRVTPEGLSPALASRWRVEQGGREVVFEIDPRARFQSGAPVTAQAVVASFQRMLKLERGPAAPFAGAVTAKSVVAVSERELRIAPELPLATLGGALAGVAILDPELVEANRGKDEAQSWLRNHLAGSGAYRVVRAEPGVQIDYARRPDDWREAAPGVEGVIWKVARESAAQRLMLQRGEAQVALDLSAEDAQVVLARAGLRVAAFPDLRSLGIRFNLRAGPFAASPALRRAAIAAFDLGALARAVEATQALAGPLPNPLFGHDLGEAPARLSPDMEAALAAASVGAPDSGKPLSIAYLDAREAHRRAAVLMREALARIGFELETRALSFAEFAASTAPGLDPAPDAWVVEQSANFADPDALVGPGWHSRLAGTWRNPAYANPAADALIEAARETFDAERRAGLYRKLQALVVGDAPGIFGVMPPRRFGFAEGVQGLDHAPGPGEGLDFSPLRVV